VGQHRRSITERTREVCRFLINGRSGDETRGVIALGGKVQERGLSGLSEEIDLSEKKWGTIYGNRTGGEMDQTHGRRGELRTIYSSQVRLTVKQLVLRLCLQETSP